MRLRSVSPRILSFVLGSLLLLSACSSSGASPEAPTPEADAVPEGKGTFIFSEYEPLADKPLTVWTYRPEGTAAAELPVVIVLHGFGRNGKTYRDQWVPFAREHEFLLVVPTFPDEYFPGGDGYNLGSVFDDAGAPVPEAEWAFSAIEPLFDHVNTITGGDRSRYALFGHSAGSQFAHRFVLFKPDNRARPVIAANAGWYTMPDFDTDFPYGLNEAPATRDALKAALGKEVVVHLGEDDDDPNAGSLRNNEQTRAQGAHRFERGRTFYQAAEAAAERLDVPFNWTLRTVPGVGHDSAAMGADAAGLLFDDSATR